MDLVDSLHIAASAMKAQSDRLRIVSENIANAESTATAQNADPYRRKTISFKSQLDHQLGIQTVMVDKYGTDNSPFIKKYDPSHPAADAEGYVLMPNVNPLVEMIDMREAQRSYEANLNVIEVSKSMITQTINLLH